MFTVQEQSNRVVVTVLALGLWLLSTAGAVASIYWIRQIYLGATMAFGGEVLTAEAVTPLLVAGLGLVATVAIIGSTEFHRRNFLKPASWRLFAWMIGIEAALAITHQVFVGF